MYVPNRRQSVATNPRSNKTSDAPNIESENGLALENRPNVQTQTYKETHGKVVRIQDVQDGSDIVTDGSPNALKHSQSVYDYDMRSQTNSTSNVSSKLDKKFIRATSCTVDFQSVEEDKEFSRKLKNFHENKLEVKH